MADILVQKIKEEIAKQNFSYKSLSLASGLGETTVRDIVIGRARNPRRDTLQKIARTLGLPVMYFLVEEQRVPLYGGQGNAGVHEHSLAAGKGETVEMPSGQGYRDMAAIRVQGDAMLPFLPDGSLVYYHERKQTGFHEWLNMLCVVQQQNMPPGICILKSSARYGRYDLATYNAVTIEDAELEWCAKVAFIKFA